MTKQTETLTVTIITCDPSTRKVEGRTKDGAPVQVLVWDIPGLFVWPVVGDRWTITRRTGGPWRLQNRVEGPEEAAPIESLSSGEAKLGADILIDSQGRTFIAVDLTTIQDGDTIRWNGAQKKFTTGP